MTPRHLVPIEPPEAVKALCDQIAHEMPNTLVVVMLELAAFRDTRTPHDARRLINALQHVAQRPDLADRVRALLEPKEGVVAELNRGDRSQ